MPKYFLAYIATLTVFLTIDFIWLSQIARKFYADALGNLLLEKPNIPAAAGFYAVYVVGIVIFAISPAMKSGSAQTALIYGALFGFFAYATYDMTNYATLRNWPISVAVVDIVWGTCLTGFSAFLGYLVTRQFMSI
jgi:uncharacterized membrane protein